MNLSFSDIKQRHNIALLGVMLCLYLIPLNDKFPEENGLADRSRDKVVILT